MKQLSIEKNDIINTRQICFFLCFMLPTAKLLTVPALLSYYAKSDILLPAILHYIFQLISLCAIIYFMSKTDKSLYSLLEEKTNNFFASTVYLLYSLFFVFLSLIPMLDLERFVYTAFFDTEPNHSAFLPFFFLSGFISLKSIKCFGRSADISMPLFIISFVGLMIMSIGQADFSNLLPILGTPIKSSATGYIRTLSHFSDTALLIPLTGCYKYKKGDAKKIISSYAIGCAFVLFFLAVFYGIFSSIAQKQEFAFVKTAQYFYPLSVVGRIDLLLTYILSTVLLFFYCYIIQISVICFSTSLKIKNKNIISIILNSSLFLYSILCNEYYNKIYYILTKRLFFIYPIFSFLIPILSLLLLFKKERKLRGKIKKYAK